MKWSVLLLVGCCLTAAAESPGGEVHYVPVPEDATLPEFFRLPEHRFEYQQQPLETAADDIQISEVTFPSPVVTEHEPNNTVHCEYFRPAAEGHYPGVVVLHILGGDFDLCRLFSRHMAHHGVAALFVKLPYYGPRSVPGGRSRMVTVDARESVAGLKQAVVDIRRAAAWLGSREEVDEKQLGIFGISLGGITSALAATAEPRFHKTCLMLAGGGIGEVTWSRRETRGASDRWLAEGGTRESFLELMRTVDPVTYGERMHGRNVLMLNASHDEVIPRECTDALWEAFGEPEIHYWDAGHYTALRFLFDGMARVTRYFQAE